jgi:AcrR family transcriptional regulator
MSTNGGTDSRTKNGLDLLWAEPGRERRNRPGLSIDRIVEAGIRIADAEGLEGLSMRRVAAELGSGAMSLYRYVPGKEELIDLMVDSVTGQTAFPDPPPQGWRARLEWSARTDWALYRRHLWSLQILATTRPPLGPNVLASTNWALGAVDGIGLSVRQMSWIVMMVAGYVQGAALLLVSENSAERDTGSTREQWWAAQTAQVMALMQSGAFPVLAKVAAESTGENDLDEWFEFGLARLMDGIEVFVAGAARPDPEPPR